MVPCLLLVVGLRRNLRPVFAELRRRPGAWLWWSFVGFGLFYAPLCFAAGYGPGWLIAGTWQITIISGSLLVPLFGEKLPVKGLLLSTLILLGIGLMQFEQGGISARAFWFGVVPVVIASFAYPLGNRKMMALCAGRLDSFQRVLGMTLASLPFWLILAAAGVFTVGAPSQGQVAQSLLVALSSGVVATGLFFRATDMVRGNMHRLAAVEATQSLEVLFTVAAEVLVLRGALPSPLAWVGMLCVVIGMVLHSLVSD
jgi:drug/metabolite transporter (DMT)-like permease